MKFSRTALPGDPVVLCWAWLGLGLCGHCAGSEEGLSVVQLGNSAWVSCAVHMVLSGDSLP